MGQVRRVQGSYVTLGEVRLGWVRLGEFRVGYVTLGEVRLGWVRLHQARLGQVRIFYYLLFTYSQKHLLVSFLLFCLLTCLFVPISLIILFHSLYKQFYLRYLHALFHFAPLSTCLNVRTLQSVQRLATGWTVRGSNLIGGKSSIPIQAGLELSLLSNRYCASLPGVKRSGRDTDHPPPCSTCLSTSPLCLFGSTGQLYLFNYLFH